MSHSQSRSDNLLLQEVGGCYNFIVFAMERYKNRKSGVFNA